MVLESVVNYLLDKYLRDYIENLDTKKLKIDLWGGNVELENLYLKPNALADLNLPVTISIGYLQKLTLQIPWKSPYSSPTKAAIDGLYLLIIPKTEVEFDPKRDEKEQYEAKMREIEKIERLRKEKEEAENDATAAKNNDTLVERIQLAVIRNLELSIRNIHIVYEDQSTKPGHPFSMGITLNYITLHTTTADWKPTVLTEDTPLTHKLGDLSALTIYWNSNVTPRSHLSREDAIKNLRETIAVNNERAPKDISYILRPMNMKAMIKLVMKPRQDGFKRPMFDIKVDLDDISLNVNRNQYSDILDLLDFQDYLTLKSKYQRYQIKDVEPQKRAVKNWKFAYNVVVNEDVRPRFECYKWKNIKAHVERKREYRSLHILTLTGKSTDEQKRRAQELEKKLDVFNLTYIRRTAEIEAKKKKEAEPKTWWGSVSNWWGGAAQQEDPNLDLQNVMSDDEKKKLFEAIGYDGEDTSAGNYPKEFIDFDLNVRLQLLDINIWAKLNDDDSQFRIVTRVSIPDTGLHFQRRPAADAMAVFVDLGSFQVFGIATNLNDNELSFKSRPVLAQPVNVNASESKLLKIEFETNPLNKKSDYRVKIVSQSLEIKYNAPTINKLNEFFEQDTQRNLQSVKQAAYSTYADVKQRSFILMKHNIEKIKVLDIDVDINSTYFLLSENGVYQENSPAICMDFGHLIIQRDLTKDTETTFSRETMSIEEAREKSYTQFKLNLTDVQLIFVHQNESWQRARAAKNTSFHLIKPMSLELDLGKCFYSDDSILPAYKVTGQIPDIDLRMSDKRLFQILNHLQTIPLPKSKHPEIAAATAEAETKSIAEDFETAEKTLEKVEAMTPMLKKKKEEEDEKKKGFEGQLTTLEASFRLKTIALHIDEASNDGGEDKPFLCITLKSIVVGTTLKTFDMDFQASLADFIVYHQQFIGKDNQQLRLLSAQLDSTKSDEDQKLISLHLLHTSPENPSFTSSTYNSIENNVDVKLNKLVVTLKLEALLSIMRFQDTLMKKLPQSSTSTAVVPVKEEKVVKKTDVKPSDTPAAMSLKVNAILQEFRILLESKDARLFDIQVQGVKAKVSQTPEKMLINLILSDLRIFDPYKEARFRKIISQQGDGQDLLQVDLSLFNHPSNYSKPIDVYDCDIQVKFAKANIVFLYKHIGAMLGFLDSLNVTKAALDIATSQADAAMEQVQKLQEQAYKVHLDITFNAPTILIPTNSKSNQALFIDLGQLTMKTTFEDDPKRFLVEQQNIRLENIRASRVELTDENEIRGEASLLECTDLKTDIHRLLFPDRAKNEVPLSIRVDWEEVHFRLAKDDYVCVMAVLTENFSENLKDLIQESSENERFHYRQEEQEKEEEKLREAVIEKQKASQTTDEVKPTMRIQAEIQKLALTLYLGESNLTSGQTNRNDELKLANVQISMFEAIFRQRSDASYKASIRVKNFLLDDLRVTNKAGSVTRMMDRHFTLDPSAHMLVVSFEFKPKNTSRKVVVRQLNAKLESLYFCISLDFLMVLQDFFISTAPKPAITTETETPIKAETPAVASPIDADMETYVDLILKNPQIILLEDQRNPNCNCLVLDMALQARLITVANDTKIYAWLKDLTVYSSNFAELKLAGDAESKVKYRILQPSKIDFMMSTTPEDQKIDIRMSSIVVSIAPAALKTIIGVTSSLGTVQTNEVEGPKVISTKSLFNVKKNDEGNFWFFQKSDDQKAIEEANAVEPAKPLFQQLVFMLDSIEVKLEVGFGSLTKSVVAMCFSNLTVDVKNWSSDMSLAAAVSIEAALFNERVHSWEPFIEPTNEKGRNILTPWALACTIEPVLPLTNAVERGPVAKQMILIRADQLLNITITKTGLELVQRLSTLFNDVYNKRLPPGADDEDAPLLSIHNRTGKEFHINELQRLQFLNAKDSKEIFVKNNDIVPLFIPSEANARIARLSVMNEADFLQREEFSIHIENHREVLSIHRMWKRVYNLVPTADERFPIQVLCDIQSHNDHRQVVLSSILRIFNHTTMKLLILNIDPKSSKPDKSVGQINVNEDFYVPIDVLYANNTGSIAFGVEESDEIPTDFFSFDWKDEFSSDRQLKLKDGSIAYFVPFKEVITCYAENTDELILPTFNLHIYPALHLTNLLPVDVECSVDGKPSISLKSSQLEIVSFGNKSSTLKFTIPSYNNVQWISDPVNLSIQGKGDHNELLVIFRNSSTSEILRLILRVDTFHASYRLQLYASFWILNRTNLRLEFQIDNISSSISTSETPFLLSSDKFGTDASKKGQIRVFGLGQNEMTANWSEKFSMDVIQSTGMATCKVPNDRTYTICVDINTSSFGVTKSVTLLPATIIVNRSTIDLEVTEVSDEKGNVWQTVGVEQFLPYWPKATKDISMRVRYKTNETTSVPFKINAKHQTLLRMDDDERSAIHVEVTATDFNGVRVIFQDYRIGDAPVLIVNGLEKDLSFSQNDDVRTQILPGGNSVFYTWADPMKSRQLVASYGNQNVKLSLEPQCGQLKLADNRIIRYAIFVDAAQTILLFHHNEQIIQTVSGASLTEDILDQRIQMDIQEIGLSIIDDTRKQELLYISLTQSGVIWTESTGRRIKPLNEKLNESLEKLYFSHFQQREIHPENRDLLTKKYPLDDGDVVFHGESAELISSNGKKRKTIQRQALPGLWIEYGVSKSKTTFHIKINRLQIDNQMETTLFPVTFHPIKPKTSSKEFADKPFLELSIYQSKSSRADIMQFKYVQLLVQEFAVKIDQGLIMAILLFFKPADTNTTPTIDMTLDLDQLNKSLDQIIKPQIDNPLNETEMYFERLHLSPLKIHVSFSLHGDTQSGDLLAIYPLVDFLLRTLNVAEVQDVILRLGYYERLNNKFSSSRLTTEVSNHYRVQFMKQLHVLVLGLDVLGNPFGVIIGVAEGVESFFYEPYKGAIEGPLEFAEGVATGVRNLLGSTIGGAAGAVSKITGVLGKGLATLSFDDDYKTSRIRRREPGGNLASEIAIGGKNVVSGFVGGVTGVVMQPVKGAKEGAGGFFKGLGKGMVGLITRPAGGIVDFASTALDAVKRTTQSEEVIRRVRYPRHVREDGVVRPFAPHEATGFFLLNRISGGETDKYGTYVTHILCSEDPFSWLMATTTCLVFISEISFLGSYEVDWMIEYNELAEIPTIRPESTELQILTKEVKKSGSVKAHRVYGKLVKCRSISDAKKLIEKVSGAMHIAGI